MTYTDVTAIVEGDEEKRERFSDLVEMIGRMAELRAILRKKRVSRGSIDFNFDEARIVLDENGKPIDIVKRERGVSNSMIEEVYARLQRNGGRAHVLAEYPLCLPCA